jgi:hypothetical protein
LNQTLQLDRLSLDNKSLRAVIASARPTSAGKLHPDSLALHFHGVLVTRLAPITPSLSFVDVPLGEAATFVKMWGATLRSLEVHNSGYGHLPQPAPAEFASALTCCRKLVSLSFISEYGDPIDEYGFQLSELATQLGQQSAIPPISTIIFRLTVPTTGVLPLAHVFSSTLQTFRVVSLPLNGVDHDLDDWEQPIFPPTTSFPHLQVLHFSGEYSSDLLQPLPPTSAFPAVRTLEIDRFTAAGTSSLCSTFLPSFPSLRILRLDPTNLVSFPISPSVIATCLERSITLLPYSSRLDAFPPSISYEGEFAQDFSAPETSHKLVRDLARFLLSEVGQAEVVGDDQYVVKLATLLRPLEIERLLRKV